MNGYMLRFYLHENHQHHGVLTWEWLLQQANKLGVSGGSAFRSVAGFGRHHVVHQDQFFGVVGGITVEVDFLATEEELCRLLDLLQRERIELFYAQTAATFGTTAKPVSE